MSVYSETYFAFSDLGSEKCLDSPPQVKISLKMLLINSQKVKKGEDE